VLVSFSLQAMVAGLGADVFFCRAVVVGRLRRLEEGELSLSVRGHHHREAGGKEGIELCWLYSV
jgi:hypothetical protein